LQDVSQRVDGSGKVNYANHRCRAGDDLDQDSVFGVVVAEGHEQGFLVAESVAVAPGPLRLHVAEALGPRR